MTNKNVLFVDDDKSIFDILRRKLNKNKYEMFFAENGAEAIEILEKTNIAVIVTDLRMPGMNGISLLENVQKLFPDSVRLVMSYLRDSSTIIAAIEKGQIFRYINKPVMYESELAPALDDALQEYEENRSRNEAIERFAEINHILAKKNEEISELENKERIFKESIVNLLKRYTLEISKYNDIIADYFENSNGDIQKKAKAIMHHLHLK